MYYSDKTLIKKARSSFAVIGVLALVIVILSQLSSPTPQVSQVLGAFTQK